MQQAVRQDALRQFFDTGRSVALANLTHVDKKKRLLSQHALQQPRYPRDGGAVIRSGPDYRGFAQPVRL
jgi:hypothetical protein